jgi:osmotically-inducible protein OsmY
MGRMDRDGSKNEVKIDKFRNSDFELESWESDSPYEGAVYEGRPNTLGGKYADNRGHRSAVQNNRDDNPFEAGELDNWNHRQGWDQYFQRRNMRSDRPQVQGGSLIGTGRDHRGRGPKGYSRPDQRIYEDVCETLALAGDVDASEVEVKVDNGIVYLKGFVTDRPTKRRAELAIENISGVHDVQNLLSIDPNMREII